MRTFKWLVLIGCLALYHMLLWLWLCWNRVPGHPWQMVLLDRANRRFYFASVELWSQDIYLLAGELIVGAVDLFLIISVAGRAWWKRYLPADDLDRSIHVVQATDRRRP